jgi:hypothetical protein
VDVAGWGEEVCGRLLHNPAHLVMLPIMEVCVCQPFLQLLVCLMSLLLVLQYSDGSNIVPVGQELKSIWRRLLCLRLHIVMTLG